VNFRIVKKEEAKPAAKPSDDSLMKKKLERDTQNSALNALLKLQTSVDSACSSALASSSNAINHLKSQSLYHC
jgi:hypothetical protein